MCYHGHKLANSEFEKNHTQTPDVSFLVVSGEEKRINERKREKKTKQAEKDKERRERREMRAFTVLC